ncbi:hypothetical protein ACFVDI_17375 [Nocardioides sp. NPDC057767]|uniref:hypothetical protein n=1 Tax=unclassified Nocardioides TaxID=2615069 RepID=UPI0036732A64
MTAWMMNAEVREPGWFEIPELPESAISSWSSEVTSALEAAWDTEFSSDTTLLIRSDLERAQRLRPGAASLTAAYWPPFGDLFFGVNVTSGRVPRLEDWVDDGYELRSYESERLGAGVECVSVDAVLRESASDVDVQIVTADYVFVDGSRCVKVSLDPMPVNYFVMMRPGIEELLQGLEVFSESGAVFRGKSASFSHIVLVDEVWGLPE